MSCSLARWLTAAALAAIAFGAQAQERAVYRCGADGRSYGQEPCAAGRSVAVDDTRSAQQIAQARQVAQRDAARADALAREREQRERAALHRGAARIGPVAAAAPDAARCKAARRPGKASCAAKEAAPRRGDRAEKVTLYRATPAR